MTDAAYQKSLRDAKRQVASAEVAYQFAQKAYNNSSIKKYGFWRHLGNWRTLRRLAKTLRENQDTLNSLRAYEKELKKD
jgi:hypothetical protein